MLVQHFLEDSARQYPDEQAVWHNGLWMSFKEINSCANRVAGCLKELKIARGDRVAILSENSFNYIVAFFAILKAGGICVPLCTESDSASLRRLLRHSDARAVVTSGQFNSRLLPALEEAEQATVVITAQEDLSGYVRLHGRHVVRLSEIQETGEDRRPDVRCIDLDPACIMYTSGSEGQPKGVCLSHLNLVSNTRSIAQYLELTAADRVMVVLPFYYVYGQSLLLTHFSVGGSVVIDNRFAYAPVIFQTMKKTRVTGFAGVPSTFFRLLNRSMLRDQKFESLRYVTQAGGPMGPAIRKRVVEAFAPARVFIMYGATEAGPRMAYLEPEMLRKKWNSVGRAVDNVELAVVDASGRRLPAGEVGEVVARGSSIMEGYWKDPVGTGQVLRNGWYHTGDLGKADEDGYLYIVGRCRDMIKVSGRRVSAQEIEETIQANEEVDEVAAVGIEDPIAGEAIKVFVVLRPGSATTEETMANRIRRLFPLYKRPKYVEFLNSLPKNGAGKILLKTLRGNGTVEYAAGRAMPRRAEGKGQS